MYFRNSLHKECTNTQVTKGQGGEEEGAFLTTGPGFPVVTFHTPAEHAGQTGVFPASSVTSVTAEAAGCQVVPERVQVESVGLETTSTISGGRDRAAAEVHLGALGCIEVPLGSPVKEIRPQLRGAVQE